MRVLSLPQLIWVKNHSPFFMTLILCASSTTLQRIPLLSVLDTVFKLRVLFFVAMQALQDDDAQRNGFIMIVLNTGQHFIFFERLPYLLSTTKVGAAIPTRPSAFHYVFDKPMLYPLAMATRVLVRNSIGRFVIHTGR